MKRIQPILCALIVVTLCAACDDISEITDVAGGTSGGASTITPQVLQGKILSFTPDYAMGGIDNWEYQFQASSVRGCNEERTFQASGWEVVNESTIKVNFGSAWEMYALRSLTGSLEAGTLKGKFEYSSSPGVTMVGVFQQVASSRYC